jgi:small conductance mechanosensitive channel
LRKQQTSATNLRASAAILPENTEIAGELSAADARVKLTAAALQKTVGFLKLLEIEDRHYRQQILTATGQITTDVLDVGVVADLVTGWTAALWDLVVEQGPKLLLKMFLVVLIIYAAIRLSRLVEMGINHGLDSSRVQISHLLRRMMVSTGRNLVVMLGILIALSQLGISLGPLLAGLGIAGFIIGFAMQDALSNFASGMLILFYRPFDVGDTVEAGGVRGKVRSMSLVNTTIMTFDNQSLVIPNNLIWSTVIKNVTAQRTRRVDLTFGISYGDDIEKAERIFRDIVTEHEKVLDSPEPMIHLHELGDSSVNFIVRPWVRTDDYWDVYWDITRTVKLRLDEEGISIPFPQRDVHVYETKSA